MRSMRLVEKASKSTERWFWWGLAALLGISLALRFWGLGRFNTLVFDEVYYVKLAKNYLTQTPYFNDHPPLSKYALAIAIWLGNQLPVGHDTVNAQAGLVFSTFSYRWFNALTGAFIPLLISGIAYQLTWRPSYALIAALFATLDGMLLVESRYALNNTHLLILGLLGLWLLLLALNRRQAERPGWLIAAGVAFGLCAGVKWNGLWFLLGAYGLWLVAKGWQWWQRRSPATDSALFDEGQNPRWLATLGQVKLWQVALYLGAIPVMAYSLSWIPHLVLCQNDPQGLCRPYITRLPGEVLPAISPTQLFAELNVQILKYHERVGGNDPKVHPYCAAWYTWLFMLRPIAYFYQVTPKGAPTPSGEWKIPPEGEVVVYDVHSIGNPLLWWLSTAAIALFSLTVGGWAIQQVWRRSPDPPDLTTTQPNLAAIEFGLAIFVLVNYAANLLPWLRVTRCTFLYHYLPASVFGWLALAWLCDRWITSHETVVRWAGIAVLISIFFAFIFWLPIYLGLPLEPEKFQWRMLLKSWV